MPIELDSLLQPISAEQPGGADIRYQPITEKIREARRQEDNLSQGVWKRDVKAADYGLVMKLTREALVKQSKDLQVAAWMTEALTQTEGFEGLRQGLELIHRMLAEFWDTAYPREDDDGDLEMRATPLRWVGSQLNTAVRFVPLTKAGHSWYQYRESRTIPTEDEARSDENKQARREEALADGKTTPEEFDEDFEKTPAEFFKARHDELKELIEYVDTVSAFCDEKFGDEAPEFGSLKGTIEEVYQAARVLLKKKGEPEQEAPREDADGAGAEATGESFVETQSTATAPARKRTAVRGAEPASDEDAIDQAFSAARFLRTAMPQSPIPYLLVRAVRWGELRANGSALDASSLAAPSSEIRMELKALANQASWEELREAAELAAAQPCGRAWLDLQRYAVTACRYSGSDAAASAILSGLRSLIADFPELPHWTLVDDTPAANAETLQWLEAEDVLPKAPAESMEAAEAPAPNWTFPSESAPVQAFESDGEPAPPDAFQLALDAARSGRVEEGIEILSREIAHEDSGRGRFLRKAQLAQVCMATGHQAIGRPILKELSGEILRRSLDQWESGITISQPLALLYQCLDGEDEAEKKSLYERICQLDPLRALNLAR